MIRRALQGLKSRSSSSSSSSSSASLPVEVMVPASQRASLNDTPPAVLAQQRFRLELGEMERGLVDMSVRCSAASLLSFKIELDQEVDVDRVHFALRCLTRIYPLLRCSVVKQHEASGNYVMEHDPDSVIPVEIKPLATTHASLFSDELQRRQLVLGSNPHRAVILPGSNAIVLVLEHFIIDGSALVHLAHRFLQSYSGEEDVTEHVVEPWIAPSCAAIRSTLKMDSLALQRRMVWEAGGMIASNVPSRHRRLRRSTLSKQFADAAMPDLSETLAFEHTLEADEVDKLKQESRKHGATLTTCVSEAYARAFAERIQANDKSSTTNKKKHKKQQQLAFSSSCVCVVDVRRLLSETNKPSPSALSPYLGAQQFTSSSKAMTQEWEMASAMSRDLKRAVSPKGADGLLVRALLNTHLTPHLPTSKLLPTFTISSWGANSPIQDKYDNGRVGVKDLALLQNYNFFMAPCLSLYPCSGTGQGRMRVAMFATVPYHHESDLEWVSQRAREILGEMMTGKAAPTGDRP